jgi:hypothetical protein
MDARIETTAAPSAGSARFPRSVLLVGAAIAALVIIALVVAVALPRTPVTYPAGSPEAAFQDYYSAWESGDIEAAYRHLSPGVTADLDLSTYRRLDSEQSWQRQQDRRLVLQGVDVTGERAVLHLRVDEFSGGGLGGQRSSFERSVRLVRQDGAWLIDEPLAGIESIAYAY